MEVNEGFQTWGPSLPAKETEMSKPVASHEMITLRGKTLEKVTQATHRIQHALRDLESSIAQQRYDIERGAPISPWSLSTHAAEVAAAEAERRAWIEAATAQGATEPMLQAAVAKALPPKKES